MKFKLPFRIKIERTSPKKENWKDIPRFSSKIIFAAILISILLHFASLLKLFLFSDQKNLLTQQTAQNPVKVTFTEKKNKPDEDVEHKKLLEVPQEKTQPPKDSKYLANEDHATNKETRVEKKLNQKTLDPGVQGNQTKPKQQSQAEAQIKAAHDSFFEHGTLGIQKKPRNQYESLLPAQNQDLLGQINAGYQDQLDEKIITGERIDMNTTNYRFIGYFTSFRKQFELVWVYPSEAVQRGLQGVVQLEIIIEKSGHVSRVKVLRSSGYALLDDATIAAVKQASPFAPLPKNMNKSRLVVVGAFHYTLNSYAGG